MKRIALCLLALFSPAAFGDYEVGQIYWCATCCDRTDDWRRWRNDAFNKSFTNEISGELGQRIISAAIRQTEERINFNLCSALTGQCLRMTANLEIDSVFSLDVPIPWIDVDAALVLWGKISGFRIRFTKANGDPVDEEWHWNKPKLPIGPPDLPFEEGHCLASPPPPPPPPPGTCSIIPPEETQTTVVFLGNGASVSAVRPSGAASVSADLTSISTVMPVQGSVEPVLAAPEPARAVSNPYTVTGCEVPLSETVAGLSPELLSIVPQHGRVKNGEFLPEGASAAFDATQLECLDERLSEQHGRSLSEGEWLVVNKPLHPENHRNPAGRMPQLILGTDSAGVGLESSNDRQAIGSVPMVIWGDETLNVLGPSLVRPELINDPIVARLRADLPGKLEITAPEEFAHPTMWIVDVSYDAAGEPVSLRRIEAATPQCCAGGGGCKVAQCQIP